MISNSIESSKFCLNINFLGNVLIEKQKKGKFSKKLNLTFDKQVNQVKINRSLIN